MNSFDKTKFLYGEEGLKLQLENLFLGNKQVHAQLPSISLGSLRFDDGNVNDNATN